MKKTSEEDGDDIPRAKKKKCDGEKRRERVQERYEALKKQHGTKYSGPQYCFWVEALEVGLHSNMEALLQRAQRSPMNSRRPLQIWPRS